MQVRRMTQTRLSGSYVFLSGSMAFLILAALFHSTRVGAGGSAMKEVPILQLGQVSSFARLALKGIQKEYPSKPADVLNSDADVKRLHPAFYGSYDWHSSVHGHWMLVRLLRLFPEIPEKEQIRSVLAAHLNAKNLQSEVDYFAKPNRQSFERTYGWA